MCFPTISWLILQSQCHAAPVSPCISAAHWNYFILQCSTMHIYTAELRSVVVLPALFYHPTFSTFLSLRLIYCFIILYFIRFHSFLQPPRSQIDLPYSFVLTNLIPAVKRHIHNFSADSFWYKNQKKNKKKLKAALTTKDKVFFFFPSLISSVKLSTEILIFSRSSSPQTAPETHSDSKNNVGKKYSQAREWKKCLNLSKCMSVCR